MSGTEETGYRPTIRDLPQGERPRERLKHYGAKNLSNTELIAILLRTGLKGENVLSLSSRVLAQTDGLSGLSRSTFGELCALKGLSQAKVCHLMASLELGRRLVSLSPDERATVNAPQDAANLVIGEMAPLDQEHLKVMLLNIRNEVLSIHEIYVGNVNASVIRPSEIIRPAVRDNAPSIIVVHNHPSGDPTPSREDVSVTRELVAAGKLMGVELLDHLVIGSGGRFVSMKDQSLGFP